MSKVKNENFITIQGWMVNELGLKGNELLIYALIFGFSQDGEQSFTGSLQYICDWTNSTKAGVSKALKKLVEKDLLEKKENYVNGVKFCEYRATKLHGGMKQSCTGYETKLHGGMKQSCTNNILDTDNNNIENNIDITSESHPHTDYEQIRVYFNTHCTSFPKIREMTDRRKKTVKAFLEKNGEAVLYELFQTAQNSDFLTGNNNTGWKADFDWIMKPANAIKILEGNYNNRERRGDNGTGLGDHGKNQAEPEKRELRYSGTVL